MTNQRSRKRDELRALGADDLAIFDDHDLIDRVVDAWSAVGRRLVRLDPDAVAARIDQAPGVVFEGAQGVLLDQTWGFHPHTTWSDCTPASARALTERPLARIGVLRAYAVRHGPGPLPTESADGPPEAHNAGDGWQGRFRTGALDGVLLRYALEVCGGVDALALTHLDRAPGHVCDAYDGPLPAELVRVRAGRVHALIPGDAADLGHRERLGQLLREVRPVRAREDPRAFVERVSGLPIGYEGRGPRAVDWTVTGGAP